MQDVVFVLCINLIQVVTVIVQPK